MTTSTMSPKTPERIMHGERRGYFEVRANGKTLARFVHERDALAFIDTVKRPEHPGVMYDVAEVSRASL